MVSPEKSKSALPAKKSLRKSKKSCEVGAPEPFQSAAQAIGVAGRVEHRRAPDPSTEDSAKTVATFVASSPYEEYDRRMGACPVPSGRVPLS